MERQRSFIILILCLLGWFPLKADYKTEIYLAYINGDMNRWRNVLDSMLEYSNHSCEFQLELTNYLYGYIAWCIGNDKSKEAKLYLTFLENKLTYLESEKFKLSVVYSYWSAYYGFKIGINKLKAPFLGPKSVKYAEMAIQQDNKNVYGYIQYGNAEYYRPVIFGGSKTKALQYYIKAETLMEQNIDEIKNDWNYLNLLVTIAKAYVEIKDYKSAFKYFEKILEVEPRFLWIKNELYPEFLKNYNKEIVN